MKNFFCQNCGANNHKHKDCLLPFISTGIICFRVDKSINIKTINSYTKIDTFNSLHLDNLKKIHFYRKKIKFLLVRRKHTHNFIEFVRGKYIVDKNNITNMFKLMSPEEIVLIGSFSFSKLWNFLWKDRASNKTFEKEFLLSQDKFNQFINIDKGNFFKYLTNDFIPNYTEPEWGFPKGKRNFFENNLDCAYREFTEETGINTNNIQLFHNIHPINEDFIGTNGINYRHIYYLSQFTAKYSRFNIKDNIEIGDIGWFTLDEVLHLFRDYHNERIKIAQKIYLFILNIIQ